MPATKRPALPPTRNGWKTCSRGHKYRGAGPCPTCWPGRAAKAPKKRLRAGR